MTDPAQLVFVPARPYQGWEVMFEMRRQADGSILLPAFSSLPLLVETLGEYQPWVCVPLVKADGAVRRHGVARLVIDPPMDGSAWRWGEAELLGFEKYTAETERKLR